MSRIINIEEYKIEIEKMINLINLMDKKSIIRLYEECIGRNESYKKKTIQYYLISRLNNNKSFNIRLLKN